MKKLRKTQLLVEPPHSATSDIAFILIVFFLVCASVQPDSGKHQLIPKTEEQKEKKEQSQNIEVKLTRDDAIIDGNPIRMEHFGPKMKSMLSGKTREEDKVVLVKSREDTPYHHWITATSMIEAAGGIITVQIEEEREVKVD